MKDRIPPEIKKLVLLRIEIAIPESFKLSIGDKGTFDKEQLKMHVEKEDEIGLQIVNMELNFIRALSSGKLTKTLIENEQNNLNN